jgi:hypothetical protein
MNESSVLIWGVAMAAAVMGALWVRKPKLRFMAWPAFGVAGMVAGLQLKSDAITNTALAFTALAIVGQIFYDGWKRGR